jgi:hypothetical protein
MRPVDGKAEADDREAGENSNEDGENQEEAVFVEDAFERGEHASGGAQQQWLSRRSYFPARGCALSTSPLICVLLAHWSAVSGFFEINSKASSPPCGALH